MLKRALSRRPAAPRLRNRVAVVAAGVGVSAALGAGVSAAADGGPAAHEAPAKPAASAQLVPTAYQASDAHHDDAHHKGGHDHAGHDHAGHHSDKGHEKGARHAAGHHHGSAHHRAKHTWVQPVHHYKLSASFDQAGGLWSHKHSGQDFAVPIGTPVSAAHSGVVVKAGPNGGGDGPAYGNAIEVYNGYDTYSQYAHLSHIKVHVGEKVKAGERIGLSGNTGNTTGPHLHFEIRHSPNYGSGAVNPVTFLAHHGLKV